MRYIKPIFKYIKRPLKRIKLYVKQKAGWLGIPLIVPYRGYGNESEVFINGMVIEDKGLSKPKDKQHVWQNILATLKRFSSDEISGVKVKIYFLDEVKITETDEMGFFHFHIHLGHKREKLLAKSWHIAQFVLIDEVVENQPEIKAQCEIRVIPPKPGRIFVSDIDDTIMVSHSTQTFRKLRLMLFKNAFTRNPFAGVSNFYQALVKGKEKNNDYPFFYVSSSEWNLYDLLDDFFAYNQLPKGVFLLRKLNHSIYKFWKSGKGNHNHKYEQIKFLLDFYKMKNFVLIGDSGQQDIAIYQRLAVEFPGRIETIYIRKVKSKYLPKTNQEIQNQLAEVNTSYVEVETTNEAAYHAISKGYINKDYNTW